MKQKKLKLLNPVEYEHVWDKKALDALEGTPGLDKMTREFYKHALERILRIQYTGSYLKVTKTNFSEVYELLEKVCEILYLKDVPNMYITDYRGIRGLAVGAEKPMIIISRRSVDWLSSDELLGLIGHEVGHIKSSHMLYHDMAQVIPILGEVIGQTTLGIGKIIFIGLEAALFHWYRMSEFTADRAGLLACQDPETYLKILIKAAGAPRTHYENIDIEEFAKQAREFKGYDYDNLDKIAKYASILWRSHPWTVMRASELLKWVDSGKYQEIIELHDKNIAKIKILCQKCGQKLQGTETFCGVCGYKVWKR